MRSRPLLAVIALLICLGSSGCATTMASRLGRRPGGENASSILTPPAMVFDLVTFPLQAPYWIWGLSKLGNGIGNHN